MGLITPLGTDPDSFWKSLLARRSGITRIRSFDPSSLPVQIAAEVPDFDARHYVPKKQAKGLRVMARTIQLAVAGAGRALEDGKVDRDKIDSDRFGVEFGASLIASELPDLADAARVSANCQPQRVDLERWGTEGLPAIQPLWMLKYLPNMLACHVSILHDARGPNNSLTENDVASLLALGEAKRIIARDQADFFLAGGAESKINPLAMSRQCLFEALSRRNDSPEKACRPFDRNRDGLVMGEGAGVLVLEELEHAKKRGARIYAEMVGFGASFDRHRDGAGLARAIRVALDKAGIGPEDIDHINAHGLSTPEVDAWEAQGLQRIFGDCRRTVPVLAVKSYVGNMGAGASTTELAVSLLALHQGQIPATLNYEDPDPRCPLAVISTPQEVTRPYVLKVSFTQLGQCAAIVCRKWS
jgi:3-oxoacyl-[acyl-carrier-protein] synthase II